jgi:cytochrome c oxidase subunit 2
VVLLALAAAAGVACGGDDGAATIPSPTGVQADDPVLAQGRDVWARSCVGCHGLDGRGLSGPALAGVVTEKYPDVAAQVAVVTNGRNLMPAARGVLTPEEIEAVVRYTREVL